MITTENVVLTKTNDLQYRDVFICDCYSTEHQLLIHYMIEEAEKKDSSDPSKITFPERHELHFEVHLTTNDSFWRRLWIGIKYAFGYKSKYGNWDNFMFRPEDAEKLIVYLINLRSNAAEVEAQFKKDVEEVKNIQIKKN